MNHKGRALGRQDIKILAMFRSGNTLAFLKLDLPVCVPLKSLHDHREGFGGSRFSQSAMLVKFVILANTNYSSLSG